MKAMTQRHQKRLRADVDESAYNTLRGISGEQDVKQGLVNGVALEVAAEHYEEIIIRINEIQDNEQ